MLPENTLQSYQQQSGEASTSAEVSTTIPSPPPPALARGISQLPSFTFNPRAPPFLRGALSHPPQRVDQGAPTMDGELSPAVLHSNPDHQQWIVYPSSYGMDPRVQPHPSTSVYTHNNSYMDTQFAPGPNVVNPPNPYDQQLDEIQSLSERPYRRFRSVQYSPSHLPSSSHVQGDFDTAHQGVYDFGFAAGYGFGQANGGVAGHGLHMAYGAGFTAGETQAVYATAPLQMMQMQGWMGTEMEPDQTGNGNGGRDGRRKKSHRNNRERQWKGRDWQGGMDLDGMGGSGAGGGNAEMAC